MRPAAVALIAAIICVGCGKSAMAIRHHAPGRGRHAAMARITAFARGQALAVAPALPCPTDAAKGACYSGFLLPTAVPAALPVNARSTLITLHASASPGPASLLVADASNPQTLNVKVPLTGSDSRINTALLNAPSGLSDYLIRFRLRSGTGPAYWLRVDSPVSVEILQMFPGGIGFGGAGSEARPLFRTANGGLGWSSVGPTTGLPAPSTFGLPVYSTLWTAVGPMHAWYVQEDATKSSAQISVFRTVDGGAVWSSTQFTVPFEYIGGAYLSFSDPLHGVLLATSTPAAGLMNKAIYVTGDGGKSFQEVSCSCLQSTDLPAGSYPDAIASVSPQDLYVVGASHGNKYSWVFRSTDGGHTFSRLTLPSAGPGYVSAWAPVFSGASGVLPTVLYGSSGLQFVAYRTVNAGQTFTPGTPVPISGLSLETNSAVYAFPNPMKGFLATGSSLYTTADGGKTWTNTPLPTTIQAAGAPLSISTDGTGNLWLLAGAPANPRLFHSSNAGQSWTPLWPALSGP